MASLIKKRNCFFILIIITFFSNPEALYSKTQTEVAGDILQFAVPVFALGYTTLIGDGEGRSQLGKSVASTWVVTEILKYTVAEERPNQKEGTTGTTFPSGHTSFCFSGASYLQTRYGYYLGVPAYILASFVGYSRVYAEKHNWTDVIAGAALSIGFNNYFTTPYGKGKNARVSVYGNNERINLALMIKF